jgi:hypothetical protein
LSTKRVSTKNWSLWGWHRSRWGGSEIFRTCPDRPRGPPSLLHSAYRVSFLGLKRPERGINRQPPSSAEVKERVELYAYSPSGLSWAVLGCEGNTNCRKCGMLMRLPHTWSFSAQETAAFWRLWSRKLSWRGWTCARSVEPYWGDSGRLAAERQTAETIRTDSIN